MMTDERAFLDLMTRFGIQPTVESHPSPSPNRFYTIRAKQNPKVIGHGEFYSQFMFDRDGKFVSLEIAE
jgi:hypothetical protein